MQALRTAATGMAAQQLNVEVISNNIANMNTVGFKKQRAEFEDLLYQNVEQAGAQSSDQGTIVPTGVQIGAGVKAGSVYRITTQGSMTQTGNSSTWRSTAAATSRCCCPPARPPTPAPATSRSTTRASWSPPTATRCSRQITDPAGRHQRHHLADRPGAGDQRRLRRRRSWSASCSSPASSTRRGLQPPRATTCSCRPAPPARRPPARPATPGFGALCRATPRPPTSTR